MMKLLTPIAISIATYASTVEAFSPQILPSTTNYQRATPPIYATTETPTEAPPTGFIENELRGAAMKLHTKMQAPNEGEAAAPTPPPEPHVTTLQDYLTSSSIPSTSTKRSRRLWYGRR